MLPSQGGLTTQQQRRRNRNQKPKKGSRKPDNHSNRDEISGDGNNHFRKEWQRHFPQKNNGAQRLNGSTQIGGFPDQRENKYKNISRKSCRSSSESEINRGEEGFVQMTKNMENLWIQKSNPSEFERYSKPEAAKKTQGKRNDLLKKKNTTCFDPSHKPADMRVLFGRNAQTYGKAFRVRDVVVAPSILCEENDLGLYSRLLQEIQSSGSDSLFVPWHGDSHLIANDRDRSGQWKEESPAFKYVIQRVEEYFQIEIKATRVNWYRDSSEWKPFHHDAAAIKPEFAKCQNCTVAASLGAERDVTFQHAQRGTMVSTPLPNGSLYAFGRDLNVQWKHGIPQLPPGQHSSQGRISIIVWGWVEMEEV